MRDVNKDSRMLENENDLSQKEASMPAYCLDESSIDNNYGNIIQEELGGEYGEGTTPNKELIEKIERLKENLNKLESEEEYLFYKATTEYLSDINRRYNDAQIIIQKANISFEKLIFEISTIIADTKIFEKNFDVLCLFKSPDINKEAMDWFSSLTRALELIKKAINGEVDENLGRIPPTNFRACIKNSSQFDPVYTLSVSTPIYRVKPDSCTDEFYPIAWKWANSFTLHSKYLLNTEQKLKSVLLTVLPESEGDKKFRSLCRPPVFEDGKDLTSYIDDYIKKNLDEIKTEIELGRNERVEELDVIETFISGFLNRITEINNVLYESKNRAKDHLSSVEKQFYKTGLSDLYKMYNDIIKLISSFEIQTHTEECQVWGKMLTDIKGGITDYLTVLGIYENDPVHENDTIWNETMEHIEIMEGEEDNSKPEGQISKINSIGFHYYNNGEQKEYIEKTKVFVYRKG